jgi:hypothetical protein
MVGNELVSRSGMVVRDNPSIKAALVWNVTRTYITKVLYSNYR